MASASSADMKHTNGRIFKLWTREICNTKAHFDSTDTAELCMADSSYRMIYENSRPFIVLLEDENLSVSRPRR